MLHTPIAAGGNSFDLIDTKKLFTEIQLKPGSKFAVIEFKKMDSKPGPPIEIRITPEQVEKTVMPYGFQPIISIEIGQFNYLSLFKRKLNTFYIISPIKAYDFS